MTRDNRPPAPGRFVSIGDFSCHLETSGTQGPPTLLLHGYLASTAIWHPVMAPLAEFCRPHAVDLPGCGYSDRPPEAPYTPAWFADVVVELMDVLGHEQMVLAGHSLGGAIAMTVALQHPQRVAGLVLASPPVYAPPPPPGLRIAKQFPGVMGRFFASPVGRLVIPGLLRKTVFANAGRHSEERVQRLLGHLDAPGGWKAATRIGLRAAAPADNQLRDVKTPTLLLWGRHDRVHPVETAHRLRDDLGGETELVILEESGHNAHEEQPAQFTEAVRGWIDRTIRRPTTHPAE